MPAIDERITVDGTEYVVSRVCEITTRSHPNEWHVFFRRVGDNTLYGFSFPLGEDWRNAPFYNVYRGGVILHPRTLESAIRETVTE